jgi:hypothetical protein
MPRQVAHERPSYFADRLALDNVFVDAPARVKLLRKRVEVAKIVTTVTKRLNIVRLLAVGEDTGINGKAARLDRSEDTYPQANREHRRPGFRVFNFSGRDSEN